MAFTPQTKQRGNVILAQDWNTAMIEIVRLGVDSLTVSGGTISGDLIANGRLGVGTGTAAPTAKLEVSGTVKATKFEGDGSALTGLNAVSNTGGTITGNLTIGDNITLTSAGALGFGTSARQMINLHGTGYAIGVQHGTQYYRTGKNFAWYKRGSHSNAELIPGIDGTAQMVLKDGDLGIGTTAPGARLEVAGTSTASANNETLVGVKIAPTFNDDGKTGVEHCGLDIGGAPNTAGQVSLQLRSGNRQNAYGSNQITLGFSNTAEYRHAIKTRHNDAARSGNAIDFYVWKYLSASDKDSKEMIGTLHTMTLDGGNVGIGTAAPGALLHVSSQNSAGTGQLRLTDTRPGGATGIDFYHHTGSLQAYIRDEVKSGWSTKLHFGTASASNNAATRMTIDGSGNVGIGTGTAALTAKLEVNGTVSATTFEGDGSKLTGIAGSPSGGSISGDLIVNGKLGIGTGTTAPGALLHVSSHNSARTGQLRLTDTSGEGGTTGIDFYHDTYGYLQAYIRDEVAGGWTTKLHFGTASERNKAATRMTIDGSGNVGIGIGAGFTRLTEKLEVNGTVKATKFVGDGSDLTGLNAVSNTSGTIAGNLTIGTTAANASLVVNGSVSATTFEGDGSKLTGIAAAGGTATASPWNDLTDPLGNRSIQYKAGKTVTIGAANAGASLQIINRVQEARDGDTLVLGKTDASSTSLKLGYYGNYAWIQSNNKPLALNPTGGNVGIGTADPKSTLDVAGYIVMRKPAPAAADPITLLRNLPNNSLIIAGPNTASLVFRWKDETGKEYELKLQGTAQA